jgi:excisionase family DNA binding protein
MSRIGDLGGIGSSLEEVTRMEKYLTKEEVAEVLGVSTKKVQRWTSAGLLRPARLGNRTLRYRPSDIEALFDRFRNASTPALEQDHDDKGRFQRREAG